MTSPQTKNQLFAEVVSLLLSVSTDKSVTVKKSRVEGIENWSIVSRAVADRSYSMSLDEAKNLAELEGNDRFAAIVPRRGRNVGDAMVLLDLSTFAGLFRDGMRGVEDE